MSKQLSTETAIRGISTTTFTSTRAKGDCLQRGRLQDVKNPANRRISVQPNSRQPARRMAVILFNSRDGAIQDLFRDTLPKLSSLCSFNTTPSDSNQPIRQLQHCGNCTTTSPSGPPTPDYVFTLLTCHSHLS